MLIPLPLTLASFAQPFDDRNWLYETEHDGFQALAVIEGGECRFYSRNRHRLTQALLRAINAVQTDAVRTIIVKALQWCRRRYTNTCAVKFSPKAESGVNKSSNEREFPIDAACCLIT